MASKVNGVISKINPNGQPLAIASTAYGYCQTAAATAAKVVDMTGFALAEGITIHVKFQYDNTASTSPTLNVNGTGAKSIMSYGTTVLNRWPAGAVMSFTYDGTNWVSDYDGQAWLSW